MKAAPKGVAFFVAFFSFDLSITMFLNDWLKKTSHF